MKEEGKNMKKKILAAALAALALVSITFTVSYTTDDPLITESYLNNVFFQKVKEYIASNTSSDGTVRSAGFELASVDKGETFVASAGCEFIIRQGSAEVVVSSLGGVSDVTDGVDIISGELPSNHHFVIARDDGRGFKALNNVLVLVKGGYQIK